MAVFLFTEIEDSTRLWEKHRDVMGNVIYRHDALVREQLDRHGGKIIKHRGDGVFAVFEKGNAVECALGIQRSIQRENWNEVGELRVRAALHAGSAEKHGEDYFGPTINRTARILDIGWGGQTLVTPEVLEECPLPEGAILQDLGVHLLKDLNDPQPILGLIAPDLALKEFPPLRSLSSHPSNLPAQPTPFVRNDAELEKILKPLSDPKARLITVIGRAGIGKTRLALQAGMELSGDFPHGVYFVDLSRDGSAGNLTAAAAQSLKYSTRAGEPHAAQLARYLKGKGILLIFDPLERADAAAEFLTEILAASPRLKILATARAALNLPGETKVVIEGMQGQPAANLFVQTAQRASAGFRATDSDLRFVAEICARLKGVPLHVEQAAAWVRTLSCEEIAGEIASNPDFLSAPGSDAR